MIFQLKKIESRLDFLNGIFLQVFLSFAASLTVMSDGVAVGWTGAKISEMTSQNSTMKMSLGQASFIGTLSITIYPLVMPIAIISSNRLGRKWTIIWAGFFIFSGWLFLVFADKLVYIYIAVILRGIGGFIIYFVPQIYIAEIAQANIRGILGFLVPISMNFGILLSYILIACTTLQNLAIFGALIMGLLFPIFMFAPESPYFLFMRNKPEEAENSLQKFRNTKDISQELNDIKAIVDKNKLDKNFLKEFFTNKICRKVTVIVLASVAFQELSGIDAILIFLQVILDSSGSLLDSDYASIVFGVAKFTACVVSLILVDKIGRRTLLIYSCSVTSCALAAIGTYFLLKDVYQYDLTSLSWLPLSILIIYILGYNIGLGTVPFILASEMYPIKFKALGSAAVQLMYCVSMIFVTEIFAIMKDNHGLYLPFWFLSIMTLFGYIYSIYCVHETKGKTLKQILIELE